MSEKIETMTNTIEGLKLLITKEDKIESKNPSTTLRN